MVKFLKFSSVWSIIFPIFAGRVSSSKAPSARHFPLVFIAPSALFCSFLCLSLPFGINFRFLNWEPGLPVFSKCILRYTPRVWGKRIVPTYLCRRSRLKSRSGGIEIIPSCINLLNVGTGGGAKLGLFFESSLVFSVSYPFKGKEKFSLRYLAEAGMVFRLKKLFILDISFVPDPKT